MDHDLADNLEKKLADDPLLSLDEVEYSTGLGQRIIRRAVRTGSLRNVVLGGRHFVRRSWLAQWLDHGDQ